MMADDLLESISFVFGIIITGVILMGLGVVLQSELVILVGAIFVGAIPILKIVFVVLERI